MNKYILLAALLAVVLFGGCSDKSVNPKSSIEPTEMPKEVAAAYESHLQPEAVVPSGGALNRTDFNPGLIDGTYDVYSVTFLWGSFAPVSIPEGLDWSGSLSINSEGYVNAVYAIDFEEGQDKILETDQPYIASWISFTNNDYDGISFLIYVRSDIETFAAIELSFKTGPFEKSFPVEMLDKYSAWFQLDNMTGIGIFARKIWSDTDPGGRFEGKWIKADNTGSKGRMEGIWLDLAGDPAGYFVGQFWTDDNGWGRFKGTVSGYYTDQIIAEFKGCWRYDDYRMCPMCGSDHGYMIGEFRRSLDNQVGVMKAEIGDWTLPVASSLELPLRGIWMMPRNAL